jgi:arginine-tRNA-protein transferase
MPGAAYEALLADGWRRSGVVFYQNHCPGCSCCIPLRISVGSFVPSRSQRRVSRRNSDVAVRIGPTTSDDELVSLYRRYVQERHDPLDPVEPEQFERFLVSSPVESRMMRYTVGDQLIGAGWVDLLADGISSVYFAFDPAESRRSLGTFSILQEIALARELDKQWLYLGFFVPGSPKMEYKGAFEPGEYAVNGKWTADNEAAPC